MTGVLEVRKLSKSFDGIVVARAVDLTLHAGRVVGLIGNSVPVELVLASGRVPTLIPADRSRPTPNARRSTIASPVSGPRSSPIPRPAARAEFSARQ